MNNLDKNYYFKEKKINILFLNSEQQLKSMLESQPGKSEQIDFLFINKNIKNILKFEPYNIIWTAVVPCIRPEGKIYYYDEQPR